MIDPLHLLFLLLLLAFIARLGVAAARERVG